MEGKKGFSYLNDGKTPTELDLGDVHKAENLKFVYSLAECLLSHEIFGLIMFPCPVKEIW